MARLTDMQIYTLRRMVKGQEYKAQGNGKRGVECRGFAGRSNDVNHPSIPPLIRLGYVDFQTDERDQNRWYYVRLTKKGREAAKQLKTSMGG